MAGFTAIDIGTRIPGMLGQLKQLAELPLRLVMASAESSEHDGVMGLVRSVSHVFNLIMGNVVGSNIFNLLLVLGFCATVAPQPITVPESALRFDIPIMFGVSLACWPIFFTGWIIDRWEGLAFLGFYATYTLFLYLKAKEHAALDPFLTTMAYVILPITALLLAVLTYRHWHNGAPDSLNTPHSDER